MFRRKWAVLIGMFFVLMFSPSASIALTGGPDAGGYEYYDSYEEGAAQFVCESIFDSGVPISDFKAEVTKEGFVLEGAILSDPVPIGFTFTFYGVEYTEVYVSKYGYLTFNDGPKLGLPYIEPIPTDSRYKTDNFIAGMWAYLHPGA